MTTTMHSRGHKDPITCYLNFSDIFTEPKDFDPDMCSAPAWHFHVRRFTTEQGFQGDAYWKYFELADGYQYNRRRFRGYRINQLIKCPDSWKCELNLHGNMCLRSKLLHANFIGGISTRHKYEFLPCLVFGIFFLGNEWILMALIMCL